MPGSRYTQYGAVAGAEDALKQMVMSRIAAEMEARKQAVENYKLAQTDRGMDLEGGRLAEDRRQFDAGAPTREAGRLYTVAQTKDLEGKPTREADARAHGAMMADASRVAAESQARTQHGYRLGEIGAQGRNQINAARASAANKTVEITVQENGQWVTKRVPESETIGKSYPVAPGANERMDSRKFSKARPVMTAIGELSERINTGKGALAKIAGSVERAKAEANLNDDVAEYDAVTSGFTPLLARALGHTGVLTEQDVQSVRKLFPTPGDSKSLRDRKVKRLESIFSELEAHDGVAGAGSGADAEFDYVNGELVPRSR